MYPLLSVCSGIQKACTIINLQVQSKLSNYYCGSGVIRMQAWAMAADPFPSCNTPMHTCEMLRASIIIFRYKIIASLINAQVECGKLRFTSQGNKNAQTVTSIVLCRDASPKFVKCCLRVRVRVCVVLSLSGRRFCSHCEQPSRFIYKVDPGATFRNLVCSSIETDSSKVEGSLSSVRE